jgi:hypothetical protein
VNESAPVAVKPAPIPTSQPQPQLSKTKVGAVLRLATQKLISRLMTEEPVALTSLQETLNDISYEQIQDILDVLQVMGLVMSVRPKRKRARTVGSDSKPTGESSIDSTVAVQCGGGLGNVTSPRLADQTTLSSTSPTRSSGITSITSHDANVILGSPCNGMAAGMAGGSGSGSGNGSSVGNRGGKFGDNDVWYTMHGFVRGPEPPEEMWDIYMDIVRRRENAEAAKKRLEELEVSML